MLCYVYIDAEGRIHIGYSHKVRSSLLSVQYSVPIAVHRIQLMNA